MTDTAPAEAPPKDRALVLRLSFVEDADGQRVIPLHPLDERITDDQTAQARVRAVLDRRPDPAPDAGPLPTRRGRYELRLVNPQAGFPPRHEFDRGWLLDRLADGHVELVGDRIVLTLENARAVYRVDPAAPPSQGVWAYLEEQALDG